MSYISTPILSAFVGQLYTSSVDISLSYSDISVNEIPSWLSFDITNSNKVDLSGTPGTTDLGLEQISFLFFDSSDDLIYEESFVINVTDVSDTAVHFVLRGLDTESALYEKMEFIDQSNIIYHHYIAKKEVVAASFDFVFWFNISGDNIMETIVNNDNINSINDISNILFAVDYTKWNNNIDISYSEFVPDSGIDACYNVIREDIYSYYDKSTVAELGVSRMARQISGSYVNCNLFGNKTDLINHYIELDTSINVLVRDKLSNGGSWDNPLDNYSTGDNNITRNLMETILRSGSDRIRECIMEASGGNYYPSYPWVPLKFQPSDKLRHRLTYSVESIVEDYSNVNITDSINHISSDQYSDIIYGGNLELQDMSSVVLTDQHFLIEYQMT